LRSGDHFIITKAHNKITKTFIEIKYKNYINVNNTGTYICLNMYISMHTTICKLLYVNLSAKYKM